MPALQLRNFGGAIPTRGDRAIPDGFAVQSYNTWLYSGELQGVKPPVQITTVNAATRKIWRIPKRTTGGDPTYPTLTPPPSYLGDSFYMQFTDPDTDIVRGPLVNDQYERWYWCSPTTGLRFNTYDNLIANINPGGFRPGVAAPTVAPTVTPASGSGTTVTRTYIYTYLNQYDEESSPSPPTTNTSFDNATWNITCTAPVADATRATVTKIRVYRTVVSASGVATYFKVIDLTLPTVTYADTLTSELIANNVILSSLNYVPPPDYLLGMISMPNGFFVAWGANRQAGVEPGNTLYFSEPYRPHAWPVEYQYTTEYPIVGLGVFGQTCVVATQGYPTAVSGIRPGQMSFVKSTVMEPCLSRGSIISTPGGVYYASHNGLMSVSGGGLQNITEQLITQEDWTRDFAPQWLRAVRYQRGYLALRATPTGARSAFFLDLTDLKVALTEFTEVDDVYNLHGDVWSGEVFMLRPAGGVTAVQQWDAPAPVNRWPVRWLSKEFQFPMTKNFGAYAIYWDDARFAPNTGGNDLIGATDKVRLRVFVNRAVKYDRVVPRNGKGVRLPSGFESDIWQFEITSRCPVYALHVATTMKELKSV